MSNYLRNVAHRTTGASLLRPRIPSRFEPVPGLGLEMNHFREVATEREAAHPRVTQAKETPMSPPPVLSHVNETQPRREESRAPKPALIAHMREERSVSRKKPEIDQPQPIQEAHHQAELAPREPTVVRSAQREITQEPVDTRVVISRNTPAERAQPDQQRIRPAIQMEVPVPVPPAAQPFPALKPERLEQPDRPERHTPLMKAEPQIRAHEFPVSPAAAQYARPAGLQSEIAAPGIHVTIGKVTVQASFPAAPVHAPARMPVHSGPLLTLERYLDRRGGRP